jgi:hypothetical protein
VAKRLALLHELLPRCDMRGPATKTYRVAIRRRACDLSCREAASRAAHIVDDDGLAKRGAHERVCDGPAQDGTHERLVVANHRQVMVLAALRGIIDPAAAQRHKSVAEGRRRCLKVIQVPANHAA